ncbi:hypothetical protein PYCCODRAFT_1149080 [Trametes coccinea BRFM310]|uniref:Uncharacterized protein n=1 Tax=Trametes coccinea (strain BRFM310) TaxID=1353009 RepID=A0A1Y2I825_TRAC3|nr:hypothetical protein PYCCODRAFT_1149080 [Trametes coccinea BRFM310]
MKQRDERRLAARACYSRTWRCLARNSIQYRLTSTMSPLPLRLRRSQRSSLTPPPRELTLASYGRLNSLMRDCGGMTLLALLQRI